MEITNICNLKCTFCPPKTLPNLSMSLDEFEEINIQASKYTKELAYHVVGDPLVLSNLSSFLDISLKHKLKVNITTTANKLNDKYFETLNHETLKQVNFSINSFNANSHKKTLDEYLNPIFDYILYAIKNHQNHFINLRIWNLDESKSAREFNSHVFKKANDLFGSSIDIDDIYKNRPKNIRIAPKVFFNFDEYFDWPSLDNEFVSNTGFCYGLDSHFSILSSGVVTPCCLDKDGIINLGNVKDEGLDVILNSPRVKKIQKDFRANIVNEELCQKCSYRTRFDK